MPAIQVIEASGDGSSIALLTGYPVDEETGERLHPYDDTILTTIGADARMAIPIAEHLQAVLDGDDELDLPIAQYESWAVLG